MQLTRLHSLSLIAASIPLLGWSQFAFATDNNNSKVVALNAEQTRSLESRLKPVNTDPFVIDQAMLTQAPETDNLEARLKPVNTELNTDAVRVKKTAKGS